MTYGPDHVSFRALEMGKAAEHIVCADLLISGHQAFLSDQGLPYDVLVDIGGRILRIQVKGTSVSRNAQTSTKAPNDVYQFYVRRRGRNGLGERLSSEHCDIVALVALDIRVVAYFPVADLAQSVSLKPPGHDFSRLYRRKRMAPIDAYPFADALARFQSAGGDQ